MLGWLIEEARGLGWFIQIIWGRGVFKCVCVLSICVVFVRILNLLLTTILDDIEKLISPLTIAPGTINILLQWFECCENQSIHWHRIGFV